MDAMTSTAASLERITVPEAARRLGIPGDEVYRLVFCGALDGRPDLDGVVRVTTASLTRYRSGLGGEGAP